MALIIAGIIAAVSFVAAAFVLLSIASGDIRGDASPMPAVWTLLIGWGVAGVVAYMHY